MGLHDVWTLGAVQGARFRHGHRTRQIALCSPFCDFISNSYIITNLVDSKSDVATVDTCLAFNLTAIVLNRWGKQLFCLDRD